MQSSYQLHYGGLGRGARGSSTTLTLGGSMNIGQTPPSLLGSSGGQQVNHANQSAHPSKPPSGSLLSGSSKTGTPATPAAQAVTQQQQQQYMKSVTMKGQQSLFGGGNFAADIPSPKKKQEQKQQQYPQWGGTTPHANGSGGGGASGMELGGSFGSKLMPLLQDTGMHNTNGASVREYAYMEDKNFKFRPSMEDTYCIKDRMCNDVHCGLFCLFDGHGGKQVADHCAERIPEEVRKEIQKNPTNDLSHSLEQVFLRIDNELRLLDSDHTGSTACVILLRQETGRRVLYVANVGDTRAVLISGASTAERLSYDHKATDKAEQERVKRDGGIIMDDRVGGALAITRAFGDHALKRDGVIAKPFVKKQIVRSSDRYIVVGSDGIWDVLEDSDVGRFCRDEMSTKEIAQAIIKAALDMGSTDNCSCIVLRFNSASPF